MNSPSIWLFGVRRKGFTLVEILIVIVLIGLLAAMAFPAFRLARTKTYAFLVRNDARQIAAAAQQYITEYTENVIIPISVDTQTGALSAPLSAYVKLITRGTSMGDYNSTVSGGAAAFTASNLYVENGDVLQFDTSGKVLE